MNLIKKDILKMMAGFRKFRDKFYTSDTTLFDRLSSSGQTPKTLMIACSDSRVDPAILFSSAPGEIFVVRNVANLVPPFESSTGFHGVSAAIEFAVVNLKVENIVVLGHRQCGGIRSLFQPEAIKKDGFVSQWMTIATDARNTVLAQNPSADIDTLCKKCEHTSIVTSLKNLRTFPFIVDAILERGLQLHGVYFDLEDGKLSYYDDTIDSFHEMNLAENIK